MRVLDTDTCIEILRGNQRVIARRETTVDEVATTWITACELFYGAAKSIRPGEQRGTVAAFLASLPVLGFNPDAAVQFGNLKSQLVGQGRPIADADLFIASIALAHDAMVVTGNLKHYERIAGLVIEDWIRS